MKQLIEQSNAFSSELSKMVEEIKSCVRRATPPPYNFEQKELDNLSFNLIDSRYLEFDRVSSFSALVELRKIMDSFFKVKETGGFELNFKDTMEENENLRRSNSKLQSCLEQIAVECQVKDDFIGKLEQKFIEVLTIVYFRVKIEIYLELAQIQAK